MARTHHCAQRLTSGPYGRRLSGGSLKLLLLDRALLLLARLGLGSVVRQRRHGNLAQGVSLPLSDRCIWLYQLQTGREHTQLEQCLHIFIALQQGLQSS
ncbi:hypothetical protein C8J57DRAFT_1313531 [Mycena rebaudengoi]|nr:hypothetical protein C8J57DRAFT_1313531 [Mycena rebaudengoi]